MKKSYINLKIGFTLIELLVVITLTIFVAGFIFVGLKNYSDEQRFNNVQSEIKSIFKETRQKTTAAETDSQFGIYFATSSLIVFEGSSYSNINPSNVIYDYPDFIILPQLSASAYEIVFARLTGEPSATGTIDIGSDLTGSVRSLVISSSGLIE